MISSRTVFCWKTIAEFSFFLSLDRQSRSLAEDFYSAFHTPLLRPSGISRCFLRSDGLRDGDITFFLNKFQIVLTIDDFIVLNGVSWLQTSLVTQEIVIRIRYPSK
jgi:hypothetical protein